MGYKIELLVLDEVGEDRLCVVGEQRHSVLIYAWTVGAAGCPHVCTYKPLSMHHVADLNASLAPKPSSYCGHHLRHGQAMSSMPLLRKLPCRYKFNRPAPVWLAPCSLPVP